MMRQTPLSKRSSQTRTVSSAACNDDQERSNDDPGRYHDYSSVDNDYSGALGTATCTAADDHAIDRASRANAACAGRAATSAHRANAHRGACVPANHAPNAPSWSEVGLRRWELDVGCRLNACSNARSDARSDTHSIADEHRSNQACRRRADNPDSDAGSHRDARNGAVADPDTIDELSYWGHGDNHEAHADLTCDHAGASPRADACSDTGAVHDCDDDSDGVAD